MIYNSTFFPNLFTMLSAFIVLGVVVVLLGYIYGSRHKQASLLTGVTRPNPVPLAMASVVLGIGIGGFIDGIVFHQILQWHQMLTNKVAPLTVEAKSMNMFWDGIFHAFSLIVVITGVILLWKLISRTGIDASSRLLYGGLLAGWGIFNIVEGTINHHLLRLHNVKEAGNSTTWNYIFLIVSILMIVIAFFIMKRRPGRNV